MSVDKEKKFDGMLSQSLKRHSEAVPADFTDRMLRQIKEAADRRILERVVLEERLALAGCILLGIMAIVVMAVFPGIAVSFKELAEGFIYRITQTIENVCYDWKLYTVLVWVLGFAIYNLMDLLVGDSWRWTRM
jgi:hypothetical protein